MSIVIKNLLKRYDGFPVVNHVSLEIADGEFFVLLGASGSGKTTVLNIIAGLTRADSGQVLLHGRDVTNLPTQQRRVGYVFQQYALFQHMTVTENVEFGLSVRKVNPNERRKRSEELLDLVGLAGLGRRMPRQLSGGQQQRVALARALASKPEVLLLDEPLGALDAKIRIELRRSLRTIQQQLGIAAILVTHDQEEAFDLADRIGVMNYGRLVEAGSPAQLYQQPQTEFVASFLGSANLLVGESESGQIRLGNVSIPYSGDSQPAQAGARVQVLFRPEEIALAAAPAELDCPMLGIGEVEEINYAGAYERLRLRLPALPGVRPIAPPVPYGSRAIRVEVTRTPDQSARLPLQVGMRAHVGVRRLHALAHPGMNFLILTDGGLRAQAAVAFGGQLARLAHARVTLMGFGQPEARLNEHLAQARKQLGSGAAAIRLETWQGIASQAVRHAAEQQPYDLVIMGFEPQEDLPLAEEILQAGEHHLLLVPAPQTVPTHALICVTRGEPAKDDVLFAGRLLRHVGARATLLSVLPPEAHTTDNLPMQRERTEQFLQSGLDTLALMGVAARLEIREGEVINQIRDTLTAHPNSMLALGVPLPQRGRAIQLDGITGTALQTLREQATLIIRSRYLMPINPLASNQREQILEEMKQ